MAEAGMLLAAFALSFAAFAAIALGQRVHHGAILGNATRGALPRALRVRVLTFGGAALAASLSLSLTAEGPSFGSILWLMLLAAASLAVTFTLTYRPRWLRATSRLLPGARSSGPRH
jgi:hypothetical protein